ncbi:MAG: secretin N-terminal domain-containing protein, partial [Candidatus Omnitrophota bacterium]
MKSKNSIKLSSFLVITLLLSGLFLIVPPLVSMAEDIPAAPESKISLELKSVDILELIRILSLKTGKTIVPSRNVSGRITIFLNNVTFQDVLDIILISQGLASDKKGDIFYIMTNAEYKSIYGKDCIEPRKMAVIKLTYAKPSNVFNAISQLKSDIGKIVTDEATGTIILIDIPEKLELMQKTAVEIDHPLETVVYDLNYVKGAEAKAQISSVITPGTGEVIVDERSGKAIVSDLPQKMQKIKDVIKELDEETRQVFIEADIVQITLSDSFNRGVDWEKVFSESKLHGLDFVGYFPVSSALSAYQKISVGKVETDKYKTIISLLSTYGNTELLSQPRIAVVNKEEATIMVGVRDAYVTQTLSQAESTTVTSEAIQFIDVGIKLKVVPTINKDGFIIMKIKPEVSSVRETISTALGSRIPIVQTTEAETVIKIKDGTTIMLGGLLERTKTETLSGTPGLSRLPVIGALFNTKIKENKKAELVVF